MKFKENAIKPGMVIHCLNENEKDVCFGYLMERDDLDVTYTNPEDEVGWFFYVYDREGKPEDMSEDITEFSDLNESDGESESANFIKSGEIIAKGISKAMKDAESSTENSAGGEKSTDTSTGMTNQRAIEILSDYIERNEHVIHDPETEAIRIATSALVEKEANKNTEKVNVLMDKYNQAKKPDEMNAVEVLEWLMTMPNETLDYVFGYDSLDEIFRNKSVNEIISNIAEFEAVIVKKPKPMEFEFGWRIEVYEENGDLWNGDYFWLGYTREEVESIAKRVAIDCVRQTGKLATWSVIDACKVKED